MQNKYLGLLKALFYDVNPIPVKTAMNLMGLNVGECRPPLFPMDEKTTKALKQKLIECNLL
jgi:4-hydroxy-tetrahydrodipicolinate synthase